MIPKFRGLVWIFVWILVLNTLGISYAFDSALDTARQSARWEFKGSYIYANTLQDIQALTPLLQTSGLTGPSSTSNKQSRQGIWFTKYSPDGNNQWNMSYALTHLLFVQGWVVYLAHPSVPLVITTMEGNQEIGRFWSDGKNWCDAVFHMDYKNFFQAEINTMKTGEYAMVDKIVLGIMGNVTTLKKRKLNPCLIKTSLEMEEVQKPDMEVKLVTNEIRSSPEQGPPDMEDKRKTGTTSAPVTPTSSPESSRATTESSMRTYQTETGGAKCNCICTCAKPSSTNSSATTLTTPAPVNPLTG